MNDAGGGGDGGGEEDGGIDAGPADAGPPRTALAFTSGRSGEVATHAIGALGTLAELSSEATGANPSFAAVSPDGRFLYLVHEGDEEVAAASIAPGTGAVSVLNRRSSNGGGPTHVSVDATGRWVFVANYGGGTVAVYPAGADGRLGDATDVESPGANAHQIVASPSNRWVLVPCLGTDRTEVFSFDAAAGTLEPAGGADATGDGPRHLAFGHDGTRVYVANELDSTVDVFRFDDATGALAHVQRESTLDGFGGGNTTAEIAVHPSLPVLYVSNRGENSIAVFDIAGDGRITYRGAALLEARTPRSFAITPDGRMLLAGAQADDRVVGFRIEADGGLTRLGDTDVPGGATFVGVFAIPAS